MTGTGATIVDTTAQLVSMSPSVPLVWVPALVQLHRQLAQRLHALPGFFGQTVTAMEPAPSAVDH